MRARELDPQVRRASCCHSQVRAAGRAADEALAVSPALSLTNGNCWTRFIAAVNMVAAAYSASSSVPAATESLNYFLRWLLLAPPGINIRNDPAHGFIGDISPIYAALIPRAAALPNTVAAPGQPADLARFLTATARASGLASQ